jgi:hypothetical protein
MISDDQLKDVIRAAQMNRLRSKLEVSSWALPVAAASDGTTPCLACNDMRPHSHYRSGYDVDATDVVLRLVEENAALRDEVLQRTAFDLRGTVDLGAQGEVAGELADLRAEVAALRETLKRVKEATLDYVTFHGPSCEWHYDEPDDSCRACLIDKRMNAACAILEGK